MVVPKKNGKIRVCIDFTNLNEASLKDSFSLPHEDQMVDVTIGHALLRVCLERAFLAILTILNGQNSQKWSI